VRVSFRYVDVRRQCVAETMTLRDSFYSMAVAEAETADPWEEPEEMMMDQPPKRDPVVRFA